jgi:hypothetical protein
LFVFNANQGNIGPPHKGLSCFERINKQLQKEQHERELFEEWKKDNEQAEFQELIEQERQKQTTKPCPNCKRLITKNGGCNHMHCTGCGRRYNWDQA